MKNKKHPGKVLFDIISKTAFATVSLASIINPITMNAQELTVPDKISEIKNYLKSKKSGYIGKNYFVEIKENSF